MPENVKRIVANFDPGLLLVLLLLTLAVSPLLRSGLPSMADVPIHLYRLMELDRCWQDGVYYPRWAPNLAFGYGYPLFDFAPPWPYFMAELFHVLGADFETALKLLAVLCFLLYGLGMYLFAREVLGAQAALLAAAAYVYTPFRFREALIYGGNYPQILAMALYPWILWAFYKIITQDRPKYIVAGACAYAGLILSHNFHALVFTPLLLAYALCLIGTTKKRRPEACPESLDFARDKLRRRACPESLGFARDKLRRAVEGWGRARAVGLALALGLALSAFFWVPALYDMRWAMVQEEYYLTHSHFYQRFLSLRELVAWPVPLDASADNPYLPFSLGPAILILAALGLAAPVLPGLLRPSAYSASGIRHPASWLRSFAGGSGGRASMRAHLLFFTLVLAASVFMMLPASAPLWENVPFLPIGEFPWRMMGLANLSLAFLAGASLYFWSAIRSKGPVSTLHPSRFTLPASLSIVVVILAAAVYLYPPQPFVEYDNPSLQDYFRYELSTQTVGTTTLNEYLPAWVKETPTTSPLMPAYLAGQPVEKLNREELPGSVQAQLVQHTVVSDHYRFTSDQPFTAHFHTFYFPAWRAYLDGQPAEIQITDPFGLMAVPVPAGEHELLLRFENLPHWTAMNALSAVALLAVLAVWVLYHSSPVCSGPPDGKSGRSGGYSWPGAFSRNQALLLGGVLVLLFLAKVLVVDPHTTWFRRRSPPGQVIGVQHPARINLEDQVLFLGYNLVSGNTVRQGGDLHVRLYWLASQPFDQAQGRPLDVNYSSFLHLDAPPDDATWATSDNVHPGDPQAQIDIPTSGWWTSLYVRDEHRLEVPLDSPPVQYLLRVGLYDRSTGKRLKVLANDGSPAGDSITLQPVWVVRARPVSPRQLPHRVAYTLGGQIELLGYDLEVADWVLGMGGWDLTLYWRAKAVVEDDYTVFVHLVDQGGKLWGQGDGVPVRGMYPTSAWLPGQVVEDRHVIQVDPAAPAGSYRVLVGLYDPATLERLEVIGPEGLLPNGVVTLEPVLEVKGP